MISGIAILFPLLSTCFSCLVLFSPAKPALSPSSSPLPLCGTAPMTQSYHLPFAVHSLVHTERYSGTSDDTFKFHISTCHS